MFYKRGNVGLILFVIFLLCAIVTFVVFAIFSDPEPVVPVNVSVNISYFDVLLSSNALSSVDYFVLFNGSSRSGVLLPGVSDKVFSVPNGSTLVFSSWSDLYYFNSSECMILSNNSRCGVVLDRKALGYNVSFDGSNLYFFGVDGGVVQRPMVCFGWSSAVLDVRLNASFVRVPSDLFRFFDVCYQLDSVIYNMSFPVRVFSNPVDSGVVSVDVLVRDSEVYDRKIIGDRFYVYTQEP